MERLERAKTMVKEAGEILLSYYGKIEQYSAKGDVDFVTEADHASGGILLSPAGYLKKNSTLGHKSIPFGQDRSPKQRPYSDGLITRKGRVSFP